MKLIRTAMKHYATSILFINTALRSRIIDELAEALESETDEKVLENMISNQDWSLKRWIEKPPFEFQLSVTYDETANSLTSVSVAYEMNLPEILGAARCCRVAARTWIAKPFRDQLFPTLYHTIPGVRYAVSKQCEWAWTSFNEDRKGMTRALKIKQAHSNENIRRFWQFWQALESPVKVNNVDQYLIVCKLEPGTTAESMFFDF